MRYKKQDKEKYLALKNPSCILLYLMTMWTMTVSNLHLMHDQEPQQSSAEEKHTHALPLEI